MNAEKMSVRQANFLSTPAYEPGRLTVKLAGDGDLDATDIIKAVLNGAHDEAQRLAVKEVVIDLTELQFLNSSGIKHFAGWLRVASQLPPEASYGIRILSSSRVSWQRRSLNALQGFAPNLLKIDAS